MTPSTASGTSTPKWPTSPPIRSGHDHSACASWLSVSSISVAFQSSANFRAISRSQRAGLAGDELERLVGPEARHLRRRERPAQRAFGQLGRILALVFGRAAAEAQRLVGAVGRGLLPM